MGRPIDPLGDARHRVRTHPARRHGRRADPHPRGVERLSRVERDGVVVEDDPGLVERLREGFAREALARYVDEKQVIVGSSGADAEPVMFRPTIAAGRPV